MLTSRYTYLRSDEVNQLPRIKVTWQPFVDGNPGSHFYVQYRCDISIVIV